MGVEIGKELAILSEMTVGQLQDRYGQAFLWVGAEAMNWLVGSPVQEKIGGDKPRRSLKVLRGSRGVGKLCAGIM